ncbi:MAG: redox-sensing transcriptional repressor Rex [Clostridia bacterium]|nr:redox-sensing transcriptional repressor Rex [Clostridia bacterium]
MAHHEISVATIQRLPLYLDYLKSVEKDIEFISATTIAFSLGLGEVQVRKDLASVSSSGKPKIGYNIHELISQLEDALGYHHVNNAIIVGAGKLGCALLGYEGFCRSGLEILAAFDSDQTKAGQYESGKPIYTVDALPDFCRDKEVRIGIITVPGEHAQKVCDLLVEAGILAIWNFAPVRLDIPKNIIVKNENMASSLAVLSTSLAKKLREA